MKKALMVISFGTSYPKTRERTLAVIEKDLIKEYPDRDFFRAFTSNFIRKKIAKRDNEIILSPEEMFESLKEEGYEDVLCQTTHIINGSEYGLTLDIAIDNAKNFKKVAIGSPLLSLSADYIEMANFVKNLAKKLKDDEALLFMGHGSEHFSNSAYPAFNYYLQKNGLFNVFLATVEGFPELSDVRIDLKNFRKIYLMPFMVVAGDHANNDLASDEENSWKSILKKDGFEVEPIIKGLGEFEEVRKIFIRHSKNPIEIIKGESIYAK